VPYGESDVIATFLTESHGKLGMVARGARRSQKRFAGVLEPLSTVRLTFEDRGRELCTLKEGRVTVPRTHIMESLEALEASGKALRFVRALCPSRTPEPEIFSSLVALLDALQEGRRTQAELLRFCFALLTGVGYGLELSRCLRCGKPRPEDRPAFVEPDKGGVVCASCGGGKLLLPAELLREAERLTLGEPVDLSDTHVALLLRVAEEAIVAHAGVEA
jgi:DNA repair protein RecO (recombination protein O)